MTPRKHKLVNVAEALAFHTSYLDSWSHRHIENMNYLKVAESFSSP
jgi:hypothetical protein